MRNLHPGRSLLLHTIRRDDDQIDLVRAALAIAWEDLGTVDVEENIQRLDALVDGLQQVVPPDASRPDQAEALVEYLHQVEGFRGSPNPVDYDDPNNSYLPNVLQRRIGLPITLALVLLYAGRELGLPLDPAALPGHFMVRCETEEGPLFLDLFYGRVLDPFQCRAFLQQQMGHLVADPARFPPPARRQVLARLLRNLKGSYLRREDYERALTATERILILEPESTVELRDRGLMYAKLGNIHRALLDLERYAVMEPTAADHELIRKHARTLADQIGELS